MPLTLPPLENISSYPKREAVLLAYVAELEKQNRHDDEADTACRNLLMEENDCIRAERDRFHAALMKILTLAPEGGNYTGWKEIAAEALGLIPEKD